MKKTNSLILSFAFLTIILSGCASTEETPKGEFATGVIIVNEGNFSESNGSVSFYNESNSEVSQDIFEKANGVATGGLIQSVYFYNNLAFIIDQLGNRIEVVDAETFKSVATITDNLSTPRYMVVANGKGYVSNWGDFDVNFDLPDSYVAVIDLDSFSVIKSIGSGNGSEGLLGFGGHVYVANSFTNTIEDIDPVTDEIISTITVASGPLSFVQDRNDKVWVLSSSYTEGSKLSQLDLSSEVVLKSFPIGNSAKSFNINGSGDKLYYLSTPYMADAEVKEVSIDATEDAAEALIVAPNLYGLGVDPKTGVLYLGNHNSFQGNGTVIRYEGSTLIDSFAAGIAPNAFVFRN